MRKLPARFDILGHTITVRLRADLESDAGCYGRWHPTTHLIELQDPEATEMSASFIMQVFWHEAVHAMLDLTGHEDLSSDEKLVDLLGQCIHQVLKTKRGS